MSSTDADERVVWQMGLDIGQRQDPSAAVLTESRGEGYGTTHAVRWGERWALGTDYGAVIDTLQHVMALPELREGKVKLVVDASGVGAPVIEMMRRRELRPLPVIVTAGSRARMGEDGWWKVPKKDLATVLALVMEQGRLKVAKGLKIATQLRKEMSAFRIKKTNSGGETFENWHEGDHDDLVFALALTLWWGEKRCRNGAGVRKPGPLKYTNGLMQPVYKPAGETWT